MLVSKFCLTVKKYLLKQKLYEYLDMYFSLGTLLASVELFKYQ